MSLLSYQSDGILNTNSMGIAEITVAQSKRASTKHRKKKDDTDGIDALDEKEDHERNEDGWDMLTANERD